MDLRKLIGLCSDVSEGSLRMQALRQQVQATGTTRAGSSICLHALAALTLELDTEAPTSSACLTSISQSWELHKVYCGAVWSGINFVTLREKHLRLWLRVVQPVFPKRL